MEQELLVKMTDANQFSLISHTYEPKIQLFTLDCISPLHFPSILKIPTTVLHPNRGELLLQVELQRQAPPPPDGGVPRLVCINFKHDRGIVN
uniref:Uncharacterized protein n=1 Tax=Helianthus annuus TaxID=4232 RepID=A0A251VMG1_HELAN